MDSKRDELISQIAAMNDESALTALTNVGEYKRACRDLEKGDAQISFANDAFIVKTGGETVTLRTGNAFSCTCISPRKCRHILTAIMAVAEKCETSKASPAPSDFSYMRSDLPQIKKLFGAKTFNAATKKYGGSLIAAEKTPTKALYNVNGYKVVFLSGGNVQSAVCGCNQPLCEHVCLALLYEYVAATGESVGGESACLDDKAWQLIDESSAFLSVVLQKGVYACTAADAQTCMFYALNLSTYSASLGGSLRSLSGAMTQAVENAALVSESKLTYYFCRAVNLLHAVRDNGGDADMLNRLLGERRAAYVLQSQNTFYCLGAYPFVADSGFAGVTHLLAETETGAIYSATDILPTVYSQEKEDVAAMTRAFYTSSPLCGRGGHRVILRNFRQSKNFRISVGEQTSAQDEGAFAKEDLCAAEGYSSDYSLCKKSTLTDYFEDSAAPRFLIVPFDCFTALYNEAAGAMEITFKRGRAGLTASLDYNEATAAAFDILERGCKKSGAAVLSEKNGKRRLLTVLTEGKNMDLYFGEQKR